jgi:hypothetical protein
VLALQLKVVRLIHSIVGCEDCADVTIDFVYLTIEVRSAFIYLSQP